MAILNTIDFTKDGDEKYITYFYHKSSNVAYKVISNGTRCAVGIREDCGIDKSMNFGSRLPKYISSKL